MMHELRLHARWCIISVNARKGADKKKRSKFICYSDYMVIHQCDKQRSI